MKRVVTAIILIAIVVLALFRAPLWLFTLLVFAVAILAAREYLDIAEGAGLKPFRALSFLFLVSLFFAIGWQLSRSSFSPARASAAMDVGYAVAILLVLASPFLLLAMALQREPLSRALPDASVSFMLLPYIGVTLLCMPLLRSSPNGALYLLYLMLMVWTGDIAALYVGRAMGKHKLAPRVSPGKSWEGSAASLAGAVVVALLVFHYVNPIRDALTRAHLILQPSSVLFAAEPHSHLAPAPLWLVIIFAICVNLAAQIGDLVESALKRGAALKDSGALLPGHGGVLDRIDALLFALPVGQLFYTSGMVLYFAERGMLG